MYEEFVPSIGSVETFVHEVGSLIVFPDKLFQSILKLVHVINLKLFHLRLIKD